ncbi:MAG: Rrf2 family transcriptional regulator [Planctomycetota bacterium]|nr:Rrf2 family transcriptional regulator [Planctomycetota bacterium]
MVSLTAEYALRAVSYLAVEHDQPRTVHQIAEATRVPPDYLSKVLQELSKLGLVRSQRGLYGGFTLVREPPQLTVLEVVQAVSPLHRIEDCPLHRDGHGPGKLCPLHKLLDDATAYIERSFAGATIADLLEADGDIRVLGLPPHTEPVRENGPVKKPS